MACRFSCANDPNKFFFICGELTLKRYKRNITDRIKNLYHAYFGCTLGDQDKVWAPHFCCVDCVNDLNLWSSGKKKSLKFAIPMIWREPKDNNRDCYFCMSNIQGHTHKKKSIQYPNKLDSAMRPVPHSDSLPVPMPPSACDISISTKAYI